MARHNIRLTILKFCEPGLKISDANDDSEIITYAGLKSKVIFMDSWNLHMYRRERRISHTLLVKHYNDLLDRQSYERGKDEVTYFYVGDVFCKRFLKCFNLLYSLYFSYLRCVYRIK